MLEFPGYSSAVGRAEFPSSNLHPALRANELPGRRFIAQAEKEGYKV